MTRASLPGEGPPTKARYWADPLRVMMARAARDRIVGRLAEQYGFEPGTVRHMFNGTRMFSREVAEKLAGPLGLDPGHVDLLLRLNKR